MSDVFKALAHPVRRDVLRALRDGPSSAGVLAGRFPVSKPTMSGHFNVAERHGTTIVYRLNASVADEAIGWLMALVGRTASIRDEEE